MWIQAQSQGWWMGLSAGGLRRVQQLGPWKPNRGWVVACLALTHMTVYFLISTLPTLPPIPCMLSKGPVSYLSMETKRIQESKNEECPAVWEVWDRSVDSVTSVSLSVQSRDMPGCMGCYSSGTDTLASSSASTTLTLAGLPLPVVPTEHI